MKNEKKTIYLLGLTSLINDLSSEAIYSLLPFYINNLSEIGFIGGMFNGLGGMLKPLFGYLTDKTGKNKTLIGLGYVLSAIAKTLISILSKVLLPVLVLLDRIGKGIRDPPRDALLGSLKKKGVAFGLHRAFDTLGALLGTILAFLIINYIGDYKTVMLFFGLMAFLTIIPISLLPKIDTRTNIKLRESLKEMFKNIEKSFFPIIIGSFSIVSPMLLIGILKSSLAYGAILGYSLYNVFYILSSYYFGKISDSIGRKPIIILSALLISITYLTLFLNKFIFLQYLSFIIYGIGVGAFIPVSFAYVSDISKFKGTSLGILQFLIGASTLISSSLLGSLIEMFGNAILLIYTIPSLISAVTLALST